MADFDSYFDLLLKFEGGYANDPDDLGGETFAGITKTYHSSWDGWVLLDSVPLNEKDLFLKDEIFMNKVKLFYKENYWEPINGDDMLDDRVAFNIFDFGVNKGTEKAIMTAEEILNKPKTGKISYEIIQDINEQQPSDFIQLYKEKRIEFYKEIASENPSRAKFLQAWLKRVDNC